MKPLFADLKKLCPQVDEELIQHHLNRLDDRYFNRFDQDTIVRHLKGLVKISSDNPVEILLDIHHNNRVEFTALAFDYASEFALITGMMTGLGLNIHSGGIHTYAAVAATETLRSQRRSPYSALKSKVDPLNRRRIIDHFAGTLDTKLELEIWQAEFVKQMKGIILLLEKGTAEFLAEAKHQVNEKVARRLENLQQAEQPILYPVEIEIGNEQDSFTRLKVVSQDTPGFLYALSNALSVKGISIEHVRINTVDNRIEDLIDFVDQKGNKLTDQAELDQVRLSVLITKQFTRFLGNAPDPYAALSRFEKLVEDVLRLPEQGEWVELLSSPKVLQELAQLLGTSDFLWEDMIRLQYETLLPMMAPHVEDRRFADSMETLPDRLEQALEKADTLEAQCRQLNEFKDQEIFLIDLDHILTPSADFKTLSDYLTYLATVIIRKAARLNYEALVDRFGKPRTVAGLETQYAILGLGKFGGAALGYASDIELLFVYSDNGQTDGDTSLANSEFFEHLVRNTAKFIRAKREGIFNIDLRLRPHGEDGSLACSLENYCNYYDPQGPAHAVERLALVRLRAVGGDAELGAKIERLRDEYIYAGKSIRFNDLREFRVRQFKEKTQGGKLNAKFSPGALVDLEYDVQILQVMYGQDKIALRTPRIHQALLGLKEAGVLQEVEFQALAAAYNFLRQLINGLRMLRGSAQDLFLPPKGTDEYSHLARRMGYTVLAGEGLDPGQQLYLEFETRTAAVRAFVDRHFGRDSLPAADVGNVADLILSDNIARELRNKILAVSGFQNTERAFTNLRRLAGDAGQRDQFARLAILACDSLHFTPDPDMALNNWEHFVHALPDPQAHFETLRSQPMRLEILLKIFSSSQFLSNTLARNPDFFKWVTDPKKLRHIRDCRDHTLDLLQVREKYPNEQDWLNALRRYRRREFLRIGTRDIALHASLPEITRELSNLAETLIQTVLERSWEGLREAGKVTPAPWQAWEKHFCILAFGKLGGRELNYSSDIDLVGLCDDSITVLRNQTAQEIGEDPYVPAMESVRGYLSQYTEEGYIYRVDLRLRPYGIKGPLIPSLSNLLHYYKTSAALSEIQALLKMRPVAGNLQLGYQFLEQVRPLLTAQHDAKAIVESVEKIRSIALKQKNHFQPVMDVKSGLGGLRDIEFMVQGLQLIHAKENPDILHGNTLKALGNLEEAGILDSQLAEQLKEDYSYIRRVEHYLQILEDQQIHSLPQDQAELLALSKRMSGQQSSAEQFLEDIKMRLQRVRNSYINNFVEKYANNK